MLRRQSAFTLIELLVVIAILAILAAILFPVFAKARERARIVTCGSNMSQIGKAVMQYTQDYDEILPMCRGYADWRNPYDNNALQTADWRAVIQPYVRNLQVYSCPTNPLTHRSGSNGWNGVSGGFDHHYGLPSAGGLATTVGFSWDLGYCTPLSRIVSPSQTLQALELANPGNPDLAGINSGETFYGHNGMANFLFCDGHVKLMKWVVTYQPICMWRFDGQVQPGWADRLPPGAR